MDTSKIIKGVVNSGRYTVTAPIMQEHYGIILKIEGAELPETYQVDFSNDEHHGTSVTMIGNADGVLIPRQFIDTGKDVFAFLYWVGEDYGKTVYKFRIPNKCRPDRTDDTPTPEEQSVIDQAISALNTAVAQTAQDVIDADASAQSASDDADRAEQAKDDAATFAQRSANSAQASADYSESAQASATASAQSASQSAQIKDDVEDLVDDAQASANASAQSATASANSASQASGYATSASQSATSAQGYASQAQTSAQTASAKASEASASAQTASNKASEASQSASQALTYKTDAESAKTASQTAQGKAEDAQTAAETAQGKAEDAQEAAESAAASVQASASQIAQNTADIADLQTDVAQNEADILKAFPTDSASGAIASFTDGADNIPLKSLVVDINPVQDLPNGDPSPENICPISGWAGCEVNATGKNLFDEANATIYKRYFRNVATSVYAWEPINDSSSYAFKCLPNTTYTLKPNNPKVKIFRVATINVNIEESESAMLNQVSMANNPRTITTDADATYIVIQLSNSIAAAKATQLQIELGDRATEYESFKGASIPISWQTEAGTVYGGKLDVLSGILTAYPYYASYNGETLTGEWISDRDVYAVGTTPTIGAQVVNIGAQGTEYQLEPHEVASLLGRNNIFADTGDIEVEYRADTKLYIERLTAPDSADMIADSNITSGQYFMVGNTLYKATSNIANGASIIVGTNCIRKSLSEALNEVNA